jgi:hypothetical protein
MTCVIGVGVGYGVPARQLQRAGKSYVYRITAALSRVVCPQGQDAGNTIPASLQFIRRMNPALPFMTEGTGCAYEHMYKRVTIGLVCLGS